jgi:hypothetical protein
VASARPRQLRGAAIDILGDNLLAWLVLAFGAALVVGNVLALVRPPATKEEGELDRAPLGRSLVMIGIGAFAALWGGATLVLATS